MFITNAEKTKLWDNISELLKKINAINADIIYLSGKIKGLEAKVTVMSVDKILLAKKPIKKKTAEQIQKQKDKQREYNRRYAAKKQFEKLERELAEKAEQAQ